MSALAIGVLIGVALAATVVWISSCVVAGREDEARERALRAIFGEEE